MHEAKPDSASYPEAGDGVVAAPYESFVRDILKQEIPPKAPSPENKCSKTNPTNCEGKFAIDIWRRESKEDLNNERGEISR